MDKAWLTFSTGLSLAQAREMIEKESSSWLKLRIVREDLVRSLVE